MSKQLHAVAERDLTVSNDPRDTMVPLNFLEYNLKSLPRIMGIIILTMLLGELFRNLNQTSFLNIFCFLLSAFGFFFLFGFSAFKRKKYFRDCSFTTGTVQGIKFQLEGLDNIDVRVDGSQKTFQYATWAPQKFYAGDKVSLLVDDQKNFLLIITPYELARFWKTIPM